ncbi:MAG TPA: hypothetical protein EYP62_04935 [Kiritimatiellae bacterium]|nr:hypothetical protein [Kiritimatiellia bacterium]
MTETTTIDPANRSPTISLPGPHTLVVGACTTFVVSAVDPDHDPVTLTCTKKPSGASFDGANLSWCAAVDDCGTTNEVEFVADDQQGETNSVVTNTTWITVPFDSDDDTLSDAWEWENFGEYSWDAPDDPDGDGMINYEEYLAGTQPTNADSAFLVGTVAGSESEHRIAVPTRGGRKYTIQFRDAGMVGAGAWSGFSNTANGIGTWTETNDSGSFTFVDDESSETTGGPPAGGRRFYRVRVEMAP